MGPAPSIAPAAVAATPVAPQPIAPQPFAPEPVLPEPIPLNLSDADASKIREIPADAVPISTYTPPATPAYLEDYYHADMELLSQSPVGVPASIIYAGDEGQPVSQTAQQLLGVVGAAVHRPAPANVKIRRSAPPSGGAQPSSRGVSAVGVPQQPSAPVAAPTPTPAPAAAPAPAAPTAPVQAGAHATVHMLAGGFKRGNLISFDPAVGVSIQPSRRGAPAETIAASEILAIFFGLAKGAAPTAFTGGQRLAVKLLNDREVIGGSPDYAPGVQAMTLIPDDRRGTDRIWVPAWSVKEIHFA